MPIEPNETILSILKEIRDNIRASYVSFRKRNPNGELSPALLANLTKPTVNH